MLTLQRILQLLVTVGALTALLGCAAAQKHESAGTHDDDSVITTRVKASIFDDTALNTLPINVKTSKAVVCLSGFVDSAQSVTRAGEIAGRVAGVMAVQNELALNY